MGRILRLIVEYVARIHNFVANYFYNHFGFTNDKMLHFLVFGLLGMLIFLVLKPIVNYLVKRNMTKTITFIFIFSFLSVLTFAIEIGQKLTNTGNMEFQDIVAGMSGFLALFLIYLIIYYIIQAIRKNINN